MSVTATQTAPDQGERRGPAGASSPLPNPAPGTSGPPVKAGRRNPPPVEFPIEMKINITPAMHIALAHFCRRRKFKPAVIGRIALMEFLERNVREYRED
jgi:hypothetical protein